VEHKAVITAIDCYRFIAAFWVVISHAGIPPFGAIFEEGSNWERVINALGMPFCGIAAVMVFFVISGFCIHYPIVCGRSIAVKWFYLARLTRILLPLSAAVCLFRFAGYFDELHLILWSIYCEVAYYLAYPLILMGIRRWSAGGMVLGALMILILVLLNAEIFGAGIRGNFASWGGGATAFLGLPVWLGGCALAEQVGRGKGGWLFAIVPSWNLWTWRVGMAFLVSVLNVAHFHSSLSYKLTMPLIGLLSVPWLHVEIQKSSMPRWLAAAGGACYSIYLMHQIGIKPIEAWQMEMSPLVRWVLEISLAALASCCFYFIIERPSHNLARWFSSQQSRGAELSQIR
jgi:peptidoglycan/LPS O-acetylase OafA/YrhL